MQRLLKVILIIIESLVRVRHIFKHWRVAMYIAANEIFLKIPIFHGQLRCHWQQSLSVAPLDVTCFLCSFLTHLYFGAMS